MDIVVLAVALGLIPAKIAHDKGYNFWEFWAAGALLWIVAMPVAILLKPKTAADRATQPAHDAQHELWGKYR